MCHIAELVIGGCVLIAMTTLGVVAILGGSGGAGEDFWGAGGYVVCRGGKGGETSPRG